ncbi:MAG: hypothetical protein GTO18_16595 [Anaerolineales bacterium]|nr:hypothetical protein [Anaerolineales bacterium]
METKWKLVILISVIAALALGGLAVLTSSIATASGLIENDYLAFVPIVLNQPEPPVIPTGELVHFTPIWELGASTEDPTVGTGGTIQGWYTKDEYGDDTRVQLELFIHVKGGTPGIGTGTYEIYLPDEIEPPSDWYVGHANAWISGGGISEFDGSIKWTMRNTVKGPKLIFTFDGREWSPTHPKLFADLKLRANIEYWL